MDVSEKEIPELYFGTSDCEYIIHCGKTNSGKTHNAVQRLKKSESGVYLAPLRLLAWEVYEKLNSENYPCNLITGEEQMYVNNAKLIASTIEMLNVDKEYDVVIVDEAFMIGDKERGKAWTRAILRARAKEVHIITNEESVDLITKLLYTSKRKYLVRHYDMLQNFKFSENYFILSKDIPNKGVFVTFKRIDVLINSLKLSNLGRSVSILYGNLPPEIKKRQIERFISGESDLMVSTDVIGMGINLPCDYIVFLDTEKFDGVTYRELSPIEVRQIAGRTGRYGMSSDKSFVSAISKQGLKFIKKRYNEKNIVEKAYFGLDYDIFISINEKDLVKRIQLFNDIKLVPNEFSSFVKKENIAKYIKIAHTIKGYEFNLSISWSFVTAPVKDNNNSFFLNKIQEYAKDGKITPPLKENLVDIKSIEDKISCYELFINLSRNIPCNKQDSERAISEKMELIEKLDKMLLDKKLSSKKKCKLCSKLISITYPYNYCESCYDNKVRRDYDDWNY